MAPKAVKRTWHPWLSDATACFDSRDSPVGTEAAGAAYRAVIGQVKDSTHTDLGALSLVLQSHVTCCLACM